MRLIGNHVLGIPQSHVMFSTSLDLEQPCAKQFIQKQNGSVSRWTCVQASLVDCRRCVSPPRLVSLLFLPTSLGTFRFALEGLFCYGSERNPDLYRKFWSDEF